MPYVQQTGDDPTTFGDHPEIYRLVINMPSYAQRDAFEQWIATGDCAAAFRYWAERTGTNYA